MGIKDLEGQSRQWAEEGAGTGMNETGKVGTRACIYYVYIARTLQFGPLSPRDC